jgi:hypothetical protein
MYVGGQCRNYRQNISYFLNNKLIFLDFWIFTNFNMVFPVIVLVFDYDEFSEGALTYKWLLTHTLDEILAEIIWLAHKNGLALTPLFSNISTSLTLSSINCCFLSLSKMPTFGSPGCLAVWSIP